MVTTYILAVSIDGEMYRFNAFYFKSLFYVTVSREICARQAHGTRAHTIDQVSSKGQQVALHLSVLRYSGMSFSKVHKKLNCNRAFRRCRLNRHSAAQIFFATLGRKKKLWDALFANCSSVTHILQITEFFFTSVRHFEAEISAFASLSGLFFTFYRCSWLKISRLGLFFNAFVGPFKKIVSRA